MAWLPDLVDGQIIYAADIDDRYGVSAVTGKVTWRGTVDAAGNHLEGVTLYGTTSATFTDGVNSSLAVKHAALPVTSSVVIEGQGSSSVFLSAPAGAAGRLAGTSGKECISQVTLADTTSTPLTPLCAGGVYGSLKIIASAGNVFGEVFIQGGMNSVIQISDLNSNIATTDTAANLCVISAGSAAYTLKNRLGASVTVTLRFFGI